MKIGNPQTPPQSNAPEQTRDSPSSRPESDRKDDAQAKRFGFALEKKASEKKQLEQRKDTDEVATAPVPPQLSFQPQSFTGPVETASAGAVTGTMPPELTALSGEILHTLEVSGPNEVHIQFDAKMLDGLSVTLVKEGGTLQVSLQASSPEMARFLEVHAASLAQSLERPDREAFIRIETRSGQSQWQDGRGSGGQGQRGSEQEAHENRHQSDAGDEA